MNVHEVVCNAQAHALSHDGDTKIRMQKVKDIELTSFSSTMVSSRHVCRITFALLVALWNITFCFLRFSL